MIEWRKTMEKLSGTRVLVLGDLMLDRYTCGDAERISPEAPILVLAADQEEVRLGGAASVACLLHYLQAHVSLVGVLGDDSDGRTVAALLDESEIDRQAVRVEIGRPTTCKHRFLGRTGGRAGQPILRVDRETRTPLNLASEQWLEAKIAELLSSSDVLLISDYNKGVCTPGLLRSAIRAAQNRPEKIPILVDPARIVDYSGYAGADLILPNRVELELVSGQRVDSPQSAIELGQEVCQRYGLPAALIKLDRDGMVVIDREHQPGFLVPTKARQVCDVTGAGDMVLAVAGLCLANGLGLRESATLANAAGGLEVERLGVEPIAWSEILAELDTAAGPAARLVGLDQLLALVNNYRRAGKSIVFTNGCFDLLHVGHVHYLQEAAGLGNVLIVAVNSDASVRRIKGPTRPLIPDRDRAALLAALSCVTHVIVFDEDTPHRLLEMIRPDVLVKGGTYTPDEIVGREIVTAYGGRVRTVGERPGISTTRLVSRIRELPCT